MKFKNTLEKYEFAERFYFLLQDLVNIKEDSIYNQLSEIFGTNLPKSIVLLDRKKHINAFESRFKTFADMAIYDNAIEIAPNIINSYLTLLEISSLNYAKDRFLKSDFKIENLPDDVLIGEFLLCRILEIDGKYFIYGDYIPMTFLHAEALVDEFTKIKGINTDLSVSSNLKYLSYDLVMFYFMTSLDKSILASEVDIFESGAISTLMMNKPELSFFIQMFSYGSDQFYDFVELLSIFYIHALLPKDKNYSSFKRIDFYEEFSNMAVNGLFKSQTELLLVLDSITDLYKFLSRFDEIYKSAVIDLKNVKKNIFKIISDLKDSLFGFYYDEAILDLPIPTSDIINDIEIIGDVIDTESLMESKNSSSLTRKSIKLLASVLEINPTTDTENLTSYHFPYIDFIYRFMRAKGLFEDSKEVCLSDRFEEFQMLDDDEIMAIIYTSIFNPEFLKAIYPPIKTKEFITNVRTLIDEMLSAPIKLNEVSSEKYQFINFFSKLGLVDMKNYASLSNAGIKLLEYFSAPAKNIISLNNYR